MNWWSFLMLKNCQTTPTVCHVISYIVLIIILSHWILDIFNVNIQSEYDHQCSQIINQIKSTTTSIMRPPGIWGQLAKSGCLLNYLGPEFLGISKHLMKPIRRNYSNASEYWRNKIKPEQLWNQTVPFFKRTKILGTACEFGLSLIFLALSECMSHLGLNTNMKW